MKILVTTKRVPDPDQKIRVKDDGSGIEIDDLPFVINAFDAIALEEALQIRERAADDTEVVALGIGSPDYESVLRSALAMGADRAIRVDAPDGLDSWNVARVVAAIVAVESPDLVLMGKQSVDDDANQAGQFLAAMLGWPQATFASKLEQIDSGLRVCRETDVGIETVRIGLPAVVTADLRLNEPRYASLPSILKAKKKPIDQQTLEALGISIEPKVEIVRLESASSERNCVRVTNVDELLEKLREVTKVV
jgi:electron transfer flavoprotein beta subunit